MAFTPIVKEKKINGVVYKAQFNGISATLKAQALAEENNEKAIEYLFKHVIIEPRIDDIDEYFGTDMKAFNDVVSFAGAIMRADEEYFPKTNKKSAKETSKE